ncbi:acyl-CoA dehydrogenase [Chitinophaga sp. 30R24]|uniref:acyl-CoA dehydrogenase n=1 Tax=Chitinophaga sp. 30R24 TaxID=3248838 RepID=UPI003B8F80D8
MKEHITHLIETYAPLSENRKMLHPALLELAYEEGWFKLFVPVAYGGPGKLLPEILRLEESLAALDGSLAWTVTLCSGAGWFAGFLDPTLAQTLFSDRKVCFAGSGEVGGIAVKHSNGYTISGTWRYASGAMHATVFTANCQLQHPNGTSILDSNGAPQVLSFILKKEEVTIIPGWSYFGLIATGSHAFEAKAVQVPLNREFKINEHIQVNSPGFNYPFLQLAETTLAVNSAGMAAHFIRLAAIAFRERTGRKSYTSRQVDFFDHTLAENEHALQTRRTIFYETFDQSWQTLLNSGHIPEEQLTAVSDASRKLAHTSRKAADALFPYCGLEAARSETTINRVWRDLHTASQHSLLTFEVNASPPAPDPMHVS